MGTSVSLQQNWRKMAKFVEGLYWAITEGIYWAKALLQSECKFVHAISSFELFEGSCHADISKLRVRPYILMLNVVGCYACTLTCWP